MSTSEQAREHLAKQRLDQSNLRKNLKERSIEAVEHPHKSEMRAEARELATGQRQQDEQRQDSMLMREKEEVLE